MKATLLLFFLVAACTPENPKSVRSTTADKAVTDQGADAVDKPEEKQPIYLPSADKSKNTFYPIKGVRPSEVCMEKGFTYLFKGYLQPECGTCHYVGNRFNVTTFAQTDEAASLDAMRRSVDMTKLLTAVITNTFCKECLIKKEDPLYADLEYFTRHMNTCETPQQ